MLLILYVGTQLVSGMVMALSADKSQRTMMMLLPFIFVPFIIGFPAGLVLYWITTNFWTIGQQFAIKKIIPRPGRGDARGGCRGGCQQTAASAAEKEKEAAVVGRDPAPMSGRAACGRSECPATGTGPLARRS